MKTKTCFILAVTLLISFLLVTQQACKKENEPSPPGGNDTLSIPETTRVIDNITWNSNFVGLDSSDYTITFKKELTDEISINVGDIIVSQDGYGYLRKVTSIETEGNNIKVYTSFASLSEAIENGSFTLETVLSEQKIMKINYLKEGVLLDTSNMKGTEETALNYDIDIYLDKPNNNVHLTGSFVLLPTVNAELIIKWFKVKKLKVEFVVDEQVSLETTIDLVDKYENEVKLTGVVFHPIIVMIGPVPVVIVPELEIFAGVELDVESNVTTSVDQSLNYTAGLLYENSDWTTYKEINKQLNYQPPSLTATAEAKAYIKPNMKLKFYSTVAPYLTGDLYGRIEADIQANPWWYLYGGANISAGVKMDIFGKELFDYYTVPPIIEYEELIADANSVGDNQAPGLPTNPTPSNNAPEQSVNVDISWTCSDPDNDPLTFDVYFGTDNPPSLATANQSEFTYNPGTLTQNTQYYWKIVARDDQGNQTEGPVWTFTTTAGGDGDTFTDPRDGQTYNIVTIGSQTWFAENLKYLPSVSPSSGGSFTDPYYYVYDYQGTNVSEAKATSEYQTYGVLYNWPAAINACPSGWHLPSDEEWKTLEMHLGMSQSEADDTGWRGTDEGKKLKSTSGWSSNGNGTDEVGFSALPGGHRYIYGYFGNLLGNAGYWWSASESGSGAEWTRHLYYNNDEVVRYSYSKAFGFSVRCLKD